MNGKTAEYSLAELVEDPLVGLVMKSDGVDRRNIELLFERVASSERFQQAKPRSER
ncbi:MAG: hypothetical protein JO095_13820 [Alphaproteobacteria bacterium]|nr:hypothetical protein [Alphaproteobacteria bacterium]MBV9199333.1 hypothetical protein [Alphaproteobacteria bacterium]MBV9816295.1 hypothetical protein [Alphaproteobacteria bacterium]